MRITVDGSGTGTSTAARDRAPGAAARDVEVPDGARLGDLRAALGELTGHPGIADPAALLAVGHLVLDDEQVVGQAPLEAGCVLRAGQGREDAASLALRADWHLAVVSGPDCGALVAVDPEVAVGRGTGRVGAGRRVDVLTIDDPLVSRHHLVVRRHGGHLEVRDLRSANGTVRRRTGRSGRVRSRRVARPLARRRLRRGDRLVLGATVLEVRTRHSAGVDQITRRAGEGHDATLTRSPMMLTTWLTPAITSAALALSTGNRTLLLLALTGPLIGAVQLLARRRGRRRTADLPRAVPGGTPPVPHAGAGSGGATDDPPSPADVVTAAIRRLEGHPGAADAPGVRLADLVPDGCLAVVGPWPLARSTTRGLLLILAGGGSPGTSARRLVVSHPRASTGQWSWLRWLTDDPDTTDGHVRPASAAPSSLGSPVGRPVTMLVELGDGRWPSWLATSWHTAPAGSEVLLVAGERALVPAWCRTVLEVRDGLGTAVLHLPDGQLRPLQLPAVSVAVAERQARRAAALTARPAVGLRGTEPPPAVAFDELPDLPAASAGSVAARWVRVQDDGLVVALGLGAGGRPVRVDLASDGPHALIAGTTGAGKSALLQTLLLGAALTCAPADLAIALVDFKGGASFGACARLPHVVGQVTDLDTAMAMRALAGLRAELRRRERLLATAGVASLAELRAAWRGSPGDDPIPPPRLLVVVDEFRALADDLPDFLPDLLRIAAQGRSLGMHLVLATQRPGGAVSADMRANIALRIALRVTDPADSHDIVGVADAASIPATLPGRAVLLRAGGELEMVQIAHAGASGAEAGRTPVRLATPWQPWEPADLEPVPGPGPGRPASPTSSPSDAPPLLDLYVESARQAAILVRSPPPRSPWLPDLPRSVSSVELARHRGDDDQHRATDRRSLPLALADVPETQSRAVVEVGERGHLLVIGMPGSGRSTTLHTLAARALRDDWHVHTVGLPDPLLADLTGHRGLGTVIEDHDPRRLARLLTALGGPTPDPSCRPGPPTLLVVDGLEQVLESLSLYARGAGDALLTDLVRGTCGRSIVVAASTGPTVSAALRSAFPARLVLSVPDPSFLAMLGVPRELGTLRRVPGRGVHLDGAATGRGDVPPRVCQVAVDVLESPSTPRTDDGAWAAPLCVRPLPVLAERPSRLGSGVGLGGDDASDVAFDLTHGALVVGPPGSGRSTALAALVACRPPTVRVLCVTREGQPLPGAPSSRARRGDDAQDSPELFSFRPDELRHLAARLGTVEDDVVVVIDDLDDLETIRPTETALVLSALDRPSGARLRLLASGRTARVATSYREPWTGLRAARHGVVLSPATAGSGDVFGIPLGWHTDVARPHHPGRGVTQVGGVVTPVQVYRTSP